MVGNRKTPRENITTAFSSSSIQERVSSSAWCIRSRSALISRCNGFQEPCQLGVGGTGPCFHSTGFSNIVNGHVSTLFRCHAREIKDIERHLLRRLPLQLERKSVVYIFQFSPSRQSLALSAGISRSLDLAYTPMPACLIPLREGCWNRRKAGMSFGELHGGYRRRSVGRRWTVRLSVPPKCLHAIERFTVTKKLFQFLPR